MAPKMIVKDPTSRIIRNNLSKGFHMIAQNAALSLVVVAILFSSFKRASRISNQYFQSLRNHFLAKNRPTALCSSNRRHARLGIEIGKLSPVLIWKHRLHGILSHLPAMQTSTRLRSLSRHKARPGSMETCQGTYGRCWPC